MVILHHTRYTQILYTNYIVITNNVGRDFVKQIISLIGYMFVEFSQFDSLLFVTFTAFVSTNSHYSYIRNNYGCVTINSVGNHLSGY